MALAKWPALLLILTACSSSAVTTSGGESAPIVVPNNGGSLEGHTPRGFAGMGTGLFAGDNLNSNFPEGDGVQIFLTFELPEPASGATSVVVASDALEVRGSPFADLGTLSAEVVSYDAFRPDLFDTPALSGPAACTRIGTNGLECDVGDIVLPLLADGATVVQLRLKFEHLADNDGVPDLAMFFRSDSNTNEPGVITLAIAR